MRLNEIANDGYKLIKGVIGLTGRLDDADFKGIWAFRNHADALRFMRSLEEAIHADDEDAEEAIDIFVCEVEMGGLLKPYVVAWATFNFDDEILYVGCGKTKEDVMEDAEEYIESAGLPRDEKRWVWVDLETETDPDNIL